jgi:predicted  nucleic acid-binding Zn ribbon protein
MMDKFTIPITREQARENLSKVPTEFKEIVAVAGAVLAESASYACPFCEKRIPLADESGHGEDCEKYPPKA